jgi:tRNA modification GTPase
MPRADEVAMNHRQASHLRDAQSNLQQIEGQGDYLIIGECLRLARASLDSITGRASTEHMLDALFGKFCIGK